MSETSALIKRIRGLGLSQSEISRRTGIPQPRVSRWENGEPASAADGALRLAALERELAVSSALAAESEGLTGVGRGLGASSAGHALQSVTAEGCAHPQSSGGGDTSAAGGDGRLAA